MKESLLIKKKNLPGSEDETQIFPLITPTLKLPYKPSVVHILGTSGSEHCYNVSWNPYQRQPVMVSHPIPPTLVELSPGSYLAMANEPTAQRQPVALHVFQFLPVLVGIMRVAPCSVSICRFSQRTYLLISHKSKWREILFNCAKAKSCVVSTELLKSKPSD